LIPESAISQNHTRSVTLQELKDRLVDIMAAILVVVLVIVGTVFIGQALPLFGRVPALRLRGWSRPWLVGSSTTE
jgi:hypothetical protein